MKFIAIIQARMSSERLPGKILAPINGYPLLKLICERTRQAKIDSWWLATTSKQADDLTDFWGQSLGLNIFRGDSENVLSRFTAIIRQEQPDWVIRLTADNPFVDYEAINILIDFATSCPETVGFIKTPEPAILPLGYIPEIFKAKHLIASEYEIPKNLVYHYTHVTSWLKQTVTSKTIEIPKGWKNRCHWRWTVDTIEDYHMSRLAFSLFGEKWLTITYQDMVNILDQHNNVTGINSHVIQKSIEEG